MALNERALDLNAILEQTIPNNQPEPIDPRHTRKVFMFFSVDLVNSTKFKSKYPNEWAGIFGRFYGCIRESVFAEYERAQIWKYIGDEVLFFVEIQTMSDILNAPSALHKAMGEAYAKLVRLNEKFVKNNLYFKGTLWIAPAYQYYRENFDQVLDPYEVAKELPANIYVEMQLNGDIYDIESIGSVSTGLDFLGPNIDEGFRMAAHSLQGKIVLDPKIAFLLSENKPAFSDSEYAKIVDFVSLNGIWGGRKYPIIWYTSEWRDKDKLFLYDDQYENSIVCAYTANPRRTKHIRYIEKVFDDLGFPLDEIKLIKDIIANTSPFSDIQTATAPSQSLST